MTRAIRSMSIIKKLRWATLVLGGTILFVGCGLAATPYDDDPGQASSTATSDVIYFSRSKSGADPNAIWRMFSNGTGQTRVAEPADGGDTDPHASADGAKVAFERRIANDTRVLVMNGDGTGLQNFSLWCSGANLPASCNGIDLFKGPQFDPQLSADGQTLLFSMNVNGGDIYSVNLATKEVVNLTKSPGVGDGTPVWSPDGSEIAWRRNNGLWIMNADGSGKRSVSLDGYEIYDIAWQPDADEDPSTDGLMLFETFGASTPAWYTKDLDNLEQPAVQVLGTPPYQASWDPSGTQLVYTDEAPDSDDAGADEIFTKPLTGGTPQRLTSYAGPDSGASWSPAIPMIRVHGASVKEGSSDFVNFKTSLSVPTSEGITVDYSVEPSDSLGAELDEDYEDTNDNPVDGQVTIPAGQTNAVISIALLDDELDEYEEAVDITLSDPTGGARLGQATAVGTIQDNDDAPFAEILDTTLDEDGGAQEVEVTLSEPSGRSVRVSYFTLAKSATAGKDYSGISSKNARVVSFAAGETSKPALVTIKEDELKEGDEDFFVKLTKPIRVNLVLNPDGTINDSERSATVTINDEQTPDVQPNEQEIAFSRFGSPPDIWTVKPDGQDLEPLLFGPASTGYDYEPSWGQGANSHKLYFSGYNDEEPDIYMRNVNNGNVVKVYETDNPPGKFGQAEEYYPAISPDGTKLAFSSSANIRGENPLVNGFGEPEIYVLTLGQTLSDTNPRQLTNNSVQESSPAWNPGGTQIVFARGEHGSKDLWRVSATGGSPVQLTNLTGNETDPDWSADGGTLAYAGDQHGDWDLFFLRNPGGSVVSMDIEQVTFETSDEKDPSFSPDGLSLAYDHEQDIATLDIEACTGDALTSGTEFDMAPDWKNPGGIEAEEVPETGCGAPPVGGGDEIEHDLAYISKADQLSAGDVFSIDPGTGDPQNVTDTTGDESAIAWNGDGTMVAFTRGFGSELWVRDATTGDETRLRSNLTGVFQGPGWHPTENVIAFSYLANPSDPSASFDLGFVDVSSQNANFMSLITESDEMAPAWSPDGSALAFVADTDAPGPENALYAVDMMQLPDNGPWVPDGAPVQLTDIAFDAMNPSWAPAGDAIAFEGFETIPDGNGDLDIETELFMYEFLDGTVQQLTNEVGNDRSPTWTPDGQTLYYSSGSEGEDSNLFELVLDVCDPPSQITTDATDEERPDYRPDPTVQPLDTPLDCGTVVEEPQVDPADAEFVFVRNSEEIWIADGFGNESLLATYPNASSPVWSPDGSQIAFASQDGLDDSEIFVMNVSDPGGAMALTDNDTLDDRPTWIASDGVAWTSIDATGDFAIVAAPAAGGDIYAVENPTASPAEDGNTTHEDDAAGYSNTLTLDNYVAFVSDREGTDDSTPAGSADTDQEVWRLLLGSTDAAVQLTHGTDVERAHLTASDDGTLLAYTRSPGPSSTIWTIDPADGTETQQTTGDPVRDPALAPSAASLAFSSLGGGWDVYAMDVNDGSTKHLLLDDAVDTDWRFSSGP